MKKANRPSVPLLALTVVGLLAGACGSEDIFPSFDELELLRELHTLTRRPPVDSTNRFADDARAAELGLALFNDKKLSGCGTVACASCHGGDGKTVDTAKAEGCDGHLTGRNPPSTLNADYNRWFMWDGRADRLWNQAILPMTNPFEMNSNATIVRARLTEAYESSYKDIFGKTPDETVDGDEVLANVGKLMQAYERKINRTSAPFDEDVRRFIAAVDVSQAQVEADPAFLGLKTYFRKGQCAVCHKGATMSDNLFHNIGVKDTSESAAGQYVAVQPMLDWQFNAAGRFSDNKTGLDATRLAAVQADLATKRVEMEGAYRTPTLRNIALTGPYMHTGELATLAEVIDFYDKGGEPAGMFTGTKTATIVELKLTTKEKQALIHLLETMTGAPQ
ncbi:cytochrome-c peroxidase [Stigmatella aurantiaca]|uniref:Di-heme cytochrome-c peroxidase n=1 Tax=Stigmatella aurantiaca (strain DW4/3-1) TaxID=378806 RepID=Q095Q4_STIAD|nr:cytochrome c peroxidase [Stigmatella aurantiaca]ADO68361.1 Di-heme cytochrome-c peroxidase [Stigmatella aurantiaca DW4/3-1]EAU67450.1 methylamine utilization protein MauG [Stigmatella aurantiaca DW4/3-1]